MGAIGSQAQSGGWFKDPALLPDPNPLAWLGPGLLRFALPILAAQTK